MKKTSDKIKTIDKTLSLFCNSYNLHGIEAPIEKNLKNQTYFLNHGNSLSWMVVPSVLGRAAYDNNFLDFKFGVIYHPLVKKIPILNKLAANLAGTMPKKHQEIITNLKNNHVDAYGTMPEAINCVLKWKDPIAKFRYNGLILASLEAESDMFVIVHKGTEVWDKHIPFLNKIPFPAHPSIPMPFKKIDLQMAILPYKPSITLSDVIDYKNRYKKVINKDDSPIDEEGIRMRRFMLENYKNL